MRTFLFTCALLPGAVTAAWAQQQPVAAVGLPPFEAPAVFKQPAPTSLEDVKAIEDHVQKILPALRAATVNLRIGNAQGSGVIINADGLCLTAAHVSGTPGQRVMIVPEDGVLPAATGNPGGGRGGNRRLRGVTLGRDIGMDASMIRIESERKDWPFCPLAKELPKPGDWCIVLGHPGGYEADRGLVVRLGRVISMTRDAIQTDCELLGGDSGGPLFNMRGEVLGINSRIGQDTDFNLHVPAVAYIAGWDRMLASEEYNSTRPPPRTYLGVKGVPNPNGKGLLLQEVFENTAAKRADIRVGDILLTFQGTEVTSLDQLKELVAKERPATSAAIVLTRSGEEMKLTARLGVTTE